MKIFTGIGKWLRPKKPAAIPTPLWQEMLDLARFVTDPQQFREHAIRLAAAYGVTEHDLEQNCIILRRRITADQIARGRR